MTFLVEVVQGDDIDIVLTIKQKSTNVAVDLTGATAITFKAKKEKGGATFVSKTLGAGIVVTTAVSGIITISLEDTDLTDTLTPAGTYIAEVQITDSTGKIATAHDFDGGFGTLVVFADLD